MTSKHRNCIALRALLAAVLVTGLGACGIPATGAGDAPADPSPTAPSVAVGDAPESDVARTEPVATARPETTARPEAAARPETTEATDVDDAVAALQHYLDLERDIYSTGDTTAITTLAAPQCGPCQARIQVALDTRAAGFEIEGGRPAVVLERRVPASEVLAPEDLDRERDADVYLLQTRVRQSAVVLTSPEGEQSVPGSTYGLRATLLDAADGRWYVVDLTETM